MVRKKDLEFIVEDLKRITGDNNFKLNWAYGGVRLIKTTNQYSGEADISPRLSKKELYKWIQAFIKGISYAYKKFCEGKESPIP